MNFGSNGTFTWYYLFLSFSQNEIHMFTLPNSVGVSWFIQTRPLDSQSALNLGNSSLLSSQNGLSLKYSIMIIGFIYIYIYLGHSSFISVPFLILKHNICVVVFWERFELIASSYDYTIVRPASFIRCFFYIRDTFLLLQRIAASSGVDGCSSRPASHQ